MADRRKRSYFPSIDSRFTGALEPSPNTGSYYNPARYANQGFSRPELSRIQRNLSNVYNQDLQYNRVANPRYQTTQDTGATSTAQFGSGRATPATTQQYALQYGTPTGNGLSTFQTPSGGSITYKPSGRQLSGGAQPTVSPSSQNITEPLAAINYGPGSTSYAQNWQKGFGTGASPYPQQQQPFNPTIGNVAGAVLNQFSPEKGAQRLGQIGTLAYNAYNSLFNQPQQQPTYAYANPGYSNQGPRRYSDIF